MHLHNFDANVRDHRLLTMPSGRSLSGLSAPSESIAPPEHIERRLAKRKRRWGWFLAWTLFVFAGGIAAGPILIDKAYSLLESLIPMLGLPRVPHVPIPRPALAPELSAKPVTAPEEPAASATLPPETAVATPPIGAARSRIVVSPLVGSEQNPALPAETEKPVGARAVRPKAKAVPTSYARTPGAGAYDPFEANDDATSAPPIPSPAGENSTSTRGRLAKSDPRPDVAKANGSLDELIAKVDSDHKGTKRVNKDIDALLKEVQKPNPEAKPKRPAPPELPSLSTGVILRVMEPVKTRARECSSRLGQTGTADLKITVAKDGRVTDVGLGGTLAGTPLADCIVRAARAATFPPNSGLRFDYPVSAR